MVNSETDFGGVVACSCQAKDKVLQSLNEALRKLKADEDAEERLHKMVADGRDRLGRLHRELGECTFETRSQGGRRGICVCGFRHLAPIAR